MYKRQGLSYQEIADNGGGILNSVEKLRNTSEEKLFIDDSIQHIESAKKIGLKTYHLDGNETLESIFPDIIQ